MQRLLIKSEFFIRRITISFNVCLTQLTSTFHNHSSCGLIFKLIFDQNGRLLRNSGDSMTHSIKEPFFFNVFAHFRELCFILKTGDYKNDKIRYSLQSIKENYAWLQPQASR